MTLKYTTTTQLAEIIGIKKTIPSWDVGDTPTNEAVGTGDASNTIFYLDHQNILSSSYTFYANAVAMTETTHYVLTASTGLITLTSAGVTLLDTDDLTAKYDYISNDMTDAFLETVLDRSETELDNMVNSTFTDGTVSNPTYPVDTEIQESVGTFMDRYILTNKPVIDITSTLASDITSADTTLDVASGHGVKFPSTGYIIIESEVIEYGGVSTDTLTGLTRASLGTTAAAHVADKDIHSSLIFFSDTSEGTDETFTIQQWDIDVFVDNTGLIYRYKDASPIVLNKYGVANRMKAIYYYGYSTIPVDITRLTLLLAKRQLMQDNISKSQIAGRDEFNPEMFNADMEEIRRIRDSYIVSPHGNT